MTTLKTRQIQYLRPEEILPEIKQAPIAYLPLGLLEWHAYHLPLGVDGFNAEAVAIRAAEQSGGLVMPTAYFGTERERPPQVLDDIGFEKDQWIVGMDFPANTLPSMYAQEEYFALFVRENLRLIANMGFKVIVLVSGHGAENQLETLKRVASDVNANWQGRAKALVALGFTKNEDGVLAVGHASRIETAIMLALHPETVNQDNLPPEGEALKNIDYAIVDYDTFSGTPTPDRTVHDHDDPRLATAEAGEAMIQKVSAEIAQLAKNNLQEFFKK